MDIDENSEILKRSQGYGIESESSENTLSYKILKIISIIIIFFLFIYIFYYLFHYIRSYYQPKEKTHLNNQINIQKFEANTNINEVDKFANSLPKINDIEISEFRRTNSENILTDTTKYQKSENPDVSIVVTMNNQAHCIHKTLRSIQNQSLKNIEIIVSIDCSLDNSTETVELFKKEDERIIVINHDKKIGGLKNKIDPLKIAKGKYVTIVDGSDALIQKDILKNALNIASLKNIDIVEFYGYSYSKGIKGATIHNHPTNGIIYQPELRSKFFIFNEDIEKWRPINCRSAWGKLIKNDVVKKTIEKIGTKYSEDYFMMFGDTMFIVALYQVAQSFYLFKDGGYYYSNDEYIGKYPEIPNKRCEIKNPNTYPETVNYINFLYDIMGDSLIEKKTLCHEIISINAFEFSNFARRLNDNFDKLYRVIDGIVDSQYLSQKEKDKLKEIRNEVKKKEEEVALLKEKKAQLKETKIEEKKNEVKTDLKKEEIKKENKEKDKPIEMRTKKKKEKKI